MLRIPRIILRQAKNVSRVLPKTATLHPFPKPQTLAYIPHIRSYAISTSGEHVEQLIDQLTDSEYLKIANEYLETLSDLLEELAETFPQIDVELSSGVMTLCIAKDKTYVINRQPPNKQIWLSSPISGPKRYDLIGGKWITLRDNLSLTELLQEELLAELGAEIELALEN